MNIRLRLRMAVHAMLYLGPLLAGLSGYGWAVVPVFAAIFLLWLFILRPQLWPQTFAGWLTSKALVALATQIALQTLVVAWCFAIGRGLGGALGVTPSFPPMLPVAVSFLSIPLARILLNPWHGNADASHGNGFTSSPQTDERAQMMLDELELLPGVMGDAELDRHLDAMTTQISSASLLRALQNRSAPGALLWRARKLMEARVKTR